jgi:hypothetical protein
MVFNATFHNISVILWQSVLLVKKWSILTLLPKYHFDLKHWILSVLPKKTSKLLQSPQFFLIWSVLHKNKNKGKAGWSAFCK